MDTRIRCIILDDELPGLAYIKMLCEQFERIEVVKVFNNPDLFLREIPSLDFDLCILDIKMGSFNGIQIANILDDKLIVFVTAYKEYATEAFDLNAVDYLVKPLQRERLKIAIDRVIARFEKNNKDVVQNEKRLKLNSDKGKVLLHPDQILYISVSDLDSRDKIIYLMDGSTLMAKNISFDRLLDCLPTKSFCRINKREILSLKIIRYFTHNEIVSTITAHGFPQRFILSDIYRNDFLEKINV